VERVDDISESDEGGGVTKLVAGDRASVVVPASVKEPASGEGSLSVDPCMVWSTGPSIAFVSLAGAWLNLRTCIAPVWRFWRVRKAPPLRVWNVSAVAHLVPTSSSR